MTGSVGTGKSTVARMFRRLGAAQLDADALAHEVIEPDRPAWRELVSAFGSGVLTRGRRVSRPRLARIVFASPTSRRRVERIIHPRVLRELQRRLAALRRRGRVRAAVVEIPLLFESGAERLVDVVVVVVAPPAVQRRRLRRHGWSLQEIEARRKAQWKLSAKVALAGEVIDNAHGVEATRTQVKRIWNRLGLERRRK